MKTEPTKKGGSVHYQKGVYNNEQTNITGFSPGSFTYVF